MPIDYASDQTAYLRGEWVKLWSGCDPATIHSTWMELVRRYGESHRYYHVMAHVADVLNNAAPVMHLVDHPVELTRALIEHDSVYAIGSKTNEEESADEAACRARRLLGDDVRHCEPIRIECKAILATKHDGRARTIEEMVAADSDLAPIGYERALFDKGGELIRLENKHLPGHLYLKRRAEFAIGLLKRQPLFYLEHFRDRYEAQAQANLRAVIQEYERGGAIRAAE